MTLRIRSRGKVSDKPIQIVNTSILNGIIRIDCKNKHTFTWAKEAATEVAAGRSYTVYDANDVPPLHKVFVWVPSSVSENYKDFVSLIDLCNDLDIKKLHYWGCSRGKDGQTFICGAEHEFLEKLKFVQYKPFCGMGQVWFKIATRTSKPTTAVHQTTAAHQAATKKATQNSTTQNPSNEGTSAGTRPNNMPPPKDVTLPHGKGRRSRGQRKNSNQSKRNESISSRDSSRSRDMSHSRTGGKSAVCSSTARTHEPVPSEKISNDSSKLFTERSPSYVDAELTRPPDKTPITVHNRFESLPDENVHTSH